jgi:hypothetical protein
MDPRFPDKIQWASPSLLLHQPYGDFDAPVVQQLRCSVRWRSDPHGRTTPGRPAPSLRFTGRGRSGSARGATSGSNSAAAQPPPPPVQSWTSRSPLALGGARERRRGPHRPELHGGAPRHLLPPALDVVAACHRPPLGREVGPRAERPDLLCPPAPAYLCSSFSSFRLAGSPNRGARRIEDGEQRRCRARGAATTSSSTAHGEQG